MAADPWPYPSYADRRWLGGETGTDRPLAAVVRGVRALVTAAGHRPSTHPASLLEAAEVLAAMSERVDWALLSVVAEARARGVSWQRIGDALGVSKQAAQQRFGPYVAEALSRAPTASATDR